MASDRFWFVRAGEGGAYAEEIVAEGIVAIGWNEVGPVDPGIDDGGLDRGFQTAYPTDREGTRKSGAAQVKRFLRELKVGDPVATYGSEQRSYFLGIIKSEAQWREARYPRFRKVKWTERVLRDGLTVGTRNTLGSALTLFLVSEEASAELRSKAVSIDSPASAQPAPPELDEDEAAEAEVEKTRSRRRIDSSKTESPDWIGPNSNGSSPAHSSSHGLQDAGLRRWVRPWRRYLCLPDGLGLQEPRIFVEVKHRVGTSIEDYQEIRAFLGGRKPGDRCLYVSTGGYSKDAKYEANRSSVPLELLTLPDLRNLLVEHYEKLDAETRSLVPLKRIYWPAG